MGLVYADIELINGDDLALVRRHIISEDEVKRMSVNMLVDSGAINMCINENVQEYMQFPLIERRRFTLASGEVREYPIVGNVEIRFKNRRTQCTAIVLPGNSEVLLGAIPLEDLDVIIDARRQELDVNPDSPDMALMVLKGIRHR